MKLWNDLSDEKKAVIIARDILEWSKRECSDSYLHPSGIAWRDPKDSEAHRQENLEHELLTWEGYGRMHRYLHEITDEKTTHAPEGDHLTFDLIHDDSGRTAFVLGANWFYGEPWDAIATAIIDFKGIKF